MVLPLANAALTTGLMAGLLAHVCWPITVISSNFASLLIIISISLAIHLIVRFRELEMAEPTQSVPERLEATLRSKFWPCFFTAGTTMVAFGSLVTSGIVPVVDFGWMMAVGVALALGVTFVFSPGRYRAASWWNRHYPRTPVFVELLGCATARHPLALVLGSGLSPCRRRRHQPPSGEQLPRLLRRGHGDLPGHELRRSCLGHHPFDVLIDSHPRPRPETLRRPRRRPLGTPGDPFADPLPNPRETAAMPRLALRPRRALTAIG